jgi:hypothetical protein
VPLCNEVAQGLELDCGPRNIANVEPVKLEGPFRDAHICVAIPNGLPRGAIDTTNTGANRSSELSSTWR